MIEVVFTFSSAESLEAFGVQLAQHLIPPKVIYLKGDLGAGKTTLARGILQGLGHEDLVKSPTFTLVETYNLPPHTLHHFDLYRIETPQELHNLGIKEYFEPNNIVLIEWPEKGLPVLPAADFMITITAPRHHSRVVTIFINSMEDASWLSTL